jgi:hypothetical protein
MRDSSARGAPLCPVGHLPHEGGDRNSAARNQPSKFDAKYNILGLVEAGAPAISPLAGEMSQRDRGGRLAPKPTGLIT